MRAMEWPFGTRQGSAARHLNMLAVLTAAPLAGTLLGARAVPLRIAGPLVLVLCAAPLFARRDARRARLVRYGSTAVLALLAFADPLAAFLVAPTLVLLSLALVFDSSALPARHTRARVGSAPMDVRTTDYHTAGEPFRIVIDGVPEIPGADVLDRRSTAIGGPANEVRALLCNEPRGHADMYGCFLVPPNDPGAVLGTLFWHKDGFSTACGHGTIALATFAVDTGLVDAPADGERSFAIDVPSGRVGVTVRRRNGRTRSAVFANVPSFVIARDVAVTTSRGTVTVDVSYGGAIYASLDASRLGLRVDPDDVTALIAVGREIKAALAGHPAAEHPRDPRLSGIYGVIWFEDLGDDELGPRQRNCTVFADGEVDRSPCGSGTSARLALLYADGRIDTARRLEHHSVIGSTFIGRVGEMSDEGLATTVEGSAHRTGEHRFVLDPDDALGLGFQLR